MNAIAFASGAHSYAITPSGACVNCAAAPLVGSTPNTSGRPFAMPSTDRRVPSGDHRSSGRGAGTLKMCTGSASRVGAPPEAGTTNSAASCSFFSRFGVETT
jgi:hypothetical protein